MYSNFKCWIWVFGFVNQQLAPVLVIYSCPNMCMFEFIIIIYKIRMKELFRSMRLIPYRKSSIGLIHWLRWHFGSTMKVNPSNFMSKIINSLFSILIRVPFSKRFYGLDFSFSVLSSIHCDLLYAILTPLKYEHCFYRWKIYRNRLFELSVEHLTFTDFSVWKWLRYVILKFFELCITLLSQSHYH